jgi:disulfide bond formation protein DsbB
MSEAEARKSQPAPDKPVATPAAETSDQAEQPGGLAAFLELLNASSRHIALLVACVATAGSLYFSDGLGLVPCVLCWYQRVLMYPLVLLIAVGIVRNDRNLPAYVFPLSLFGLGMALYHYLLTKTSWLPVPDCQAGGVPCSIQYFNWLGFINIPLMAFTAFAIISIMMGADILVTNSDSAVAKPAHSQQILASGVALTIVALTVLAILFI